MNVIVKDIKARYDDKELVAVAEIINMEEATGEPKFKDYPYLVTVGIMPKQLDFEIINDALCEEGYKNQEELNKDMSDYFYADAIQYAGSCQVDTYLEEENDEGFSYIHDHFNIRQACLKTNTMDYGGLAYDYGKGHKVEYLQFRTEEDAERYANLVIDSNNELLDSDSFIENCMYRSSNLMGDTWSSRFDTLKAK